MTKSQLATVKSRCAIYLQGGGALTTVGATDMEFKVAFDDESCTGLGAPSNRVSWRMPQYSIILL
jgi:hypothetical protein